MVKYTYGIICNYIKLQFKLGVGVMKKVISALLFTAIGTFCFYFAFQKDTEATLGGTLAILGVLSFGYGLYKSWHCGILSYVLDIFFFWI